MRSNREPALANLAILATLAEHQGLTLLLHPQLWRLVEPAPFAASVHEDDADFLREAMHATDRLAVGCAVQIPSGRAAGDDFPRTMLPVDLAGLPFAIVRFWSSGEPSIQVFGTDAVLADVGEIAGGVASAGWWAGVMRDSPLPPEEAWAAYQAALVDEQEQRAQYERERPQREAAVALKERALEVERQRREAERRAVLRAELETRYGTAVLRVTDDRGSSEIRQFPDGRADCVSWENDWESFDDLLVGFDDRDPFDEGLDARDRLTPVRIEKFPSIVDCLRSRLTPQPTDAILELHASIEQIEAMLAAAGLADLEVAIDHDDFVFDGEHILTADFARAGSLAEAENALQEIWSFHAGVEGSRWTREIYEMIGSTNGVFFYIEREDQEGSITKLGRLSHEEALAMGQREAVRSDDDRGELLRDDPDSEQRRGD